MIDPSISPEQPCMVPGCVTERSGADGRPETVPSPRKGEQPLCAPHWYRVPRELRHAYWDRRTNAPGSAAYRAALDEVIAAAGEEVT